MKKIILSLTIIAGVFSYAQVVTNQDVTVNYQSNAFLDASDNATNFNSESNRNVGRGLGFPETDLTVFRLSDSNAGDSFYNGMLVYNTAKSGSTTDPSIVKTDNLTEGFYYFFNPKGRESQSLSEGKWVKIANVGELSTGVASGDFWSLTGNTLTSDDRYLGTKNDKNVVMKVNVDKVNIPAGDVAGYNPTKLILGNAGDAPAFTKVVIGGTPTEQAEALAKKTKNVQPAGQTTPKDFNFVLEVFGKARFKDGLVTQASTYPDYVFDSYFTGKSEENPNYEFKKLNEVEDFIKENNHLPGVTSIKELTKSENGYNVDNTQLSIQTLEKVEELYLHVIEQQKEIQALKAELAELKK